ncbi:MAG: hypothetical protein MI919_20610, partial [Holophagales bacterium]|nr:hypothetical protein [Holophagales bacterium]
MAASMGDAYYRRIVRALEARDFDPLALETCACELLRDEYPGLVPIPGGNDGGIDGAIADLDSASGAEPYPLVVTSEEDVVGNLTNGLKRYLALEGAARRAVVATSRALTPPRRRNLFAHAKKLGFILRQVYDQPALASRLYRSPSWTQQLLGVSGKPAALSALPPVETRPFVETELLGRAEDLEWLGSAVGDRVIVGQPGSGKSYLLHRAAREGHGLFLATRDEERIADAVRAEKPRAIFVDDSHLDPDILGRLRSLRRELGAELDLVAVTWPGSAEAVTEALGVVEPGVRRLELLTRHEIVDLLGSLGVEAVASVDELRVLADQASNRPGLAVTLARLWLEGDWVRVLRGDALRRAWLASLRRLVGEDVADLLAGLALGGRRGMATSELADVLGWSLRDIRRVAPRLAGSGLVRELSRGVLAVEPSILRPNLLGHAFFERTEAELPLGRILELAPNRGATAFEAVQAAAMGYPVPEELLHSLLVSSDVDPTGLVRDPALDAWRLFAKLSEKRAAWAFEQFPGDPSELADAALDSAPGASLALLLRKAAAWQGPLHSQPSHPLRKIQDWMRRIPHDAGDAIQRRLRIVRVARDLSDELG